MNERLPKFKGKKLLAEIAKSTQGLIYISETDAQVEPFNAANVDVKNIIDLIPDDGLSETREPREFFSRLTTVKDWFGAREKQRAKRFAALERLLTENLRDLTVVRVGRIQIDIYVVGLDDDNNLVGIKTKAVET